MSIDRYVRAKEGVEKVAIASLLRIGKEKAMPVRVEILAALNHELKPVSIKQICILVQSFGFNQSTVYRAVETLVKFNFIKKIPTKTGECLYETNLGRKHHHHITCTSCGRIEDIAICVNSPSKECLHTKGFSEVTDHAVEFFGVCRTCAKV